MTNYRLVFFAASFIIITTGCNNRKIVPFPSDETEFAKPVSEPLKFSQPKKIDWIITRTDTAKPAVTRKINLDNLPSKTFNPDGFHQLESPMEETRFDINTLPDTVLNVENIPSQPLRFQTSFIKPPVIIKAGLPKLRKNTAMGIFEFGEDQGLPGAFVSTMMQDSHGMMWIATDQGLCCFNGEYLEIYSFIDAIFTGALASVSSLMEDKQGRIWIKTDINGIYVFDRNAGLISHIDFPLDGFQLNNDYEMIMDSKGLIWNSSVASGISIIDPQKQTIRHLPKLGLSKNAKQIIKDNEDNIWVGSITGLSIIDHKSGKIRFITRAAGLASDTVTSLFMDHEKNIWIGTAAKDVEIINAKEGAIKHLSSHQGIDQTINHFVEDNDKHIWMSSDSGVYVFERSSQKIRNIDAAKGLSDSKIKTIVKDNNEQMWVSTYTGLNLINTKGILPEYFNQNDGLTGSEVWTFIQDAQHRIWLGSLQSIDIFYPDKQIIKSAQKELQLKKARTISYLFAPSTDGKMLISAAGFAVAIVDTKKDSITYITKAQGQQVNYPSSIMSDNKGRIWTGGFQNKGIEVFDMQKNSFTRLTNKNGLIGSIVWAMMQDNKGEIWAATDSGINIINMENGTIRYLMQSENVSKENGGNLLSDEKGRIWIATRTRILIADEQNKLLTSITTNEGLAAPDVYTLFENKGIIYAGTGNGLTVFSPRGSNSSADQNQSEWNIKSYAKGQGFLYNNYNSGAAFAYNNKLWWGIEANALTITNEPKEDSSISVTYINGITLSDKIQNFTDNKWVQHHLKSTDTIWSIKKDTFYVKDKLPEDSSWLQKKNIEWDSVTGYFNLPVNLTLPFNQNYLSFQFTGSQLTNKDKTRYRYILEGVDKSWSAITDKPFSENYRDIPAGKYTFKVCSRGFNGIWSQPAEFSFTILPPWWRTWWAYLLYAAIFYLIVRSIVRYRSRWLKKENMRLEEMVTQRTNELTESINKLKTTQSQLVQSEKMASLGELTAGIAHEIQNPLNFVNNFSEVNIELSDELSQEAEKGNIDEVKIIAKDIKENSEKINHHGRRADAIVKGMLQHSRLSAGVKEPTDINALADEYLRLAYHGLRAKDKDFNSALETDFDHSIGKINIIPQDIGRVLLNLYTNAFYAVAEKQKQLAVQKVSPLESYQPTVSVSTKKSGNQVFVNVSDNGNGIPQKVVDKIFQPFFTTKPTGQGTGLGLSMSYDIIKAHSGEIKVETKEGEGTAFTIIFPNTNI